jgi:FtsP/CotA-like multicopper oxidase with cupredoxin domain
LGSPTSSGEENTSAEGIRTALTCILDWINPPNRSRIAIDFAQPFRGKQTYMLHCHNLEHEDQGMMVAFTVDD